MSAWPWSVLGIAATRDAGVVRKAYADALRALDLDKEVRAYAELRQARDEALWLASQGDAEEDEGDFGLGSLDDPPSDSGGDLGFDLASVRFSETGSGVNVDATSGWTPEADAGERNAAPLDQPPLDEALERARIAWDGLLAILYPDGEYSEEGISLDQLAEGNGYLAALIARADECDIDEHHALDHRLAQVLAETWPRSAPFVELVAEAFHWLDQSGHIEERPPLMFLNLRLRGMRFHEKVQQDSHPLNKAWVELTRPGKASFLDKARAKVRRDDIHQLLNGIRERYPEVESYLDPERVASWESASAPGAVGSAGFPWWVGLLIVVLVLRFVSSLGSSNSDTSPPPIPPAVMAELGRDGVVLDMRIGWLLGEGTTMDDVRSADPVFADQLHNALARERDGSSTVEGIVRRQAFGAASVAEFDELIAIAELKQLWMLSAIANPDQCRNITVGDFNSLPLNLDRPARMREAQLLRQLLDAGVLSHQGGREASSFSVPGWVIEQVMERSGLSEDQVAAALRDPDSSQRCLVDLTLLGVVLKEPGRVSQDLLRGL